MMCTAMLSGYKRSPQAEAYHRAWSQQQLTYHNLKRNSSAISQTQFQSFQLTNWCNLHIGGVRHEEVTVEVSWPGTSRRSHSHNSVKCNRTWNVLDNVSHQTLAVDISLEIRVLEYFSAGQSWHLSNCRQVNVRVVKDKQINRAARIDTILTQIIVSSRLWSWGLI